MRKNETINAANITRLALVAAMYAVLTVMITPLSYGDIQLRFSEVLVLLCFYRRDYAPALIIGCFIANLFSPMGIMDIVFGTLATAVAVFPMYRMRNIFLAALLPVISNGIIVGTELTVAFGTPIWLNMLSVAFGELVVVGVIGIAVFKLLFETNPVLPRIIGSTRKSVRAADKNS